MIPITKKPRGIRLKLVALAYLSSFLIGTTSADAQLANPGFEANGAQVPIGSITSWDALGSISGGTITDFKRSGSYALGLWWPETVLVQPWAASPGELHNVSAYAYSSSGNPFSAPSAIGALRLQYLDSSGTVIKEYGNDNFVPATSPQDQWLNFQAQGFAPDNTVTARLFCGIVNGGTMSGLFGFDDCSRTEITPGETCGEISNPGFEDGPDGDTYQLEDGTDEFFDWTWVGGSNSGFVNQNQARSGFQSLAVTFPENFAQQDFGAETSISYVVKGSIYNPDSEKLAGEADGMIVLQFMEGTNIISDCVVGQFEVGDPTNTWMDFCITNHAPIGLKTTNTAVTGRVMTAIFGGTAGYDGALYFDDICVTETNIVLTNQQAGEVWDPGFEYNAKGTFLPFLETWTPFGLDGKVRPDIVRSGSQALQIYALETLVSQTWPASQGERHFFQGYGLTPSDDRLSGTVLGQGQVQAIAFFEFRNSGGSVLATHTSSSITTGSTPDVWTLLRAEGVAPSGTASVRAFAGIVGGFSLNFSGSVWFDDFSQGLVLPTDCGLLSNPGFDDGPEGNAFDLEAAGDLPAWDWEGGDKAGFIQPVHVKDDLHALAITFPENVAVQDFAATTGMSYILDGYLFTPSGSSTTLQGVAHGSLILEFHDANAAESNKISATESAFFTTNTAQDTWVYFSVTARAPFSVNSGVVTGRAVAAILGDTNDYGGAVYFDQLCLVATNIMPSMTQCGTIDNPGFEDTQSGTKLSYIDDWEAFGISGEIQSALRRSGQNALRIDFNQTLVGQLWSATRSNRYSSSAHALTPSSDPFTAPTNPAVQALTILQFLDADTNEIIAYASNPFTTNTPTDVWTQLVASGVAPSGTVYGRTLVGVVESDDNYGGAMYFDDVCQSLEQVGPTTCGDLVNPSFDDMPTGDAQDLAAAGDFIGWTWLGATNGGFVTRDAAMDGDQSLVFTYPKNVAAQRFAATSGETYIIEGYMMTPTETPFTSDGSSFGLIVLSFYTNGATSATTSASSGFFTNGMTPDVWHYFAATGTAPAEAGVTGEVVLLIESAHDNPTNDAALGGVIFYDEFCVSPFALSAFNLWQIEHFGSTSEPEGGPDDDYDMDNVSNWDEFIAGTEATNDMSYFSVTDAAGTPTNGGFVIKWGSVAGRYYDLRRITNLVTATYNFAGVNISATPPVNCFTDIPPASLNMFIYGLNVKTNATPP